METLRSHETFEKRINQSNIVFYFTAGWCPDCRVIEPVLPEIEAEFPNYTFVKVDRDEFIDICQEYAIFGIPSFVAFRNGEETGRFVSKNRKTKEEIVQFLNNLPN
ncbi:MULTISPECIES: thioredoxin family protein [Virgibacillus]|uniref:Thioredoxin-like protein YtpP n=2 Tax=Virgibacillus TaxID=84406 RepID=A0A024Q9V3_9BACI|nr:MULTISPECIES: thioredoxin family protein [Virgibacillus]EQB35672.1 hypothetical protein M948_11555 [Virgibacillus sp. CM-4]MYL41475.1 thiol reductase thioredoxin [Virgibacillus massiliensis]GGJ50594.1 thiol reductase thioredoxin [Virgibacillus kapii]CDQ39279.1 Thioredoxin-like protein YtpP [Virgibacillus massiliensis]